MKRNLMLVTTILIIGISVLVIKSFFITSTENYSNVMENNIKKGKGGTIEMISITPFKWDKAYVIEDPFTNGDRLNKLIGIESDLERLETDMKRRIIFIYNDKIAYDYIYSIVEFNFSPKGVVIDNNQKLYCEKKGDIIYSTFQ